MSSLPWMCFDDFNGILSNDEKEGGVLKLNSLMDNFHNAMFDSQLHDLGSVGNKFT